MDVEAELDSETGASSTGSKGEKIQHCPNEYTTHWNTNIKIYI